jgi:hypothetical protein
MRRVAGATPDANGRAVDFDHFGRRKRTRVDAKMRRTAGDALNFFVEFATIFIPEATLVVGLRKKLNLTYERCHNLAPSPCSLVPPRGRLGCPCPHHPPPLTSSLPLLPPGATGQSPSDVGSGGLPLPCLLVGSHRGGSICGDGRLQPWPRPSWPPLWLACEGWAWWWWLLALPPAGASGHGREGGQI